MPTESRLWTLSSLCVVAFAFISWFLPPDNIFTQIITVIVGITMFYCAIALFFSVSKKKSKP